MGNSGSTHNLHVERSSSELNYYLQTQTQRFCRTTTHPHQLSRKSGNSPDVAQRSHTADWRRSYPTPGSKSDLDNHAQFKVLPKLDERLHLRATSNGAILNSGGTISGRKQGETQLQRNPVMQRSRTFLLDSIKDDSAAYVERNIQRPEFTRSQTMLHLKVKVDKTDNSLSKTNVSNLEHMQRHTYSEPDFIKKISNETKTDKRNILEGFAPTSRQNKYNKKRRAPEAPTAAAAAAAAATTTTTSLLPADSGTSPLGQQLTRTQHFTKHKDRASKLHLNKPSQNSATFERGNAAHNSIRVEQVQERPQFLHRREKSSDSIMLRSRKGKAPDINTIKVESPAARTEQTLTTTKIPQLKRTFYFGMDLDSTAKSDQAETEQATKEQPAVERRNLGSAKVQVQSKRSSNTPSAEKTHPAEGASQPYVQSYYMPYDNSQSQEENIEDNGLRVRIRPTLPRRQVETPTFSPVTAWRGLIEEQDRLERLPLSMSMSKKMLEAKQHKKDNIKEAAAATDSREAPIQPKTMPQVRQVLKLGHIPKTWTPEQDLVDELDATNEKLVPADDSSSDEYQSKCEEDGLLFYGSKAKKTGVEAAPAATSAVHLFSLSLPRDSHIQQHMDSGKTDSNCIYKSLQKTKPGYYFNSALSPNRQRNLANTTQSNNISLTKFDGSNNWMLHKNVPSSLEQRSKSLNCTMERPGLPSIEPQSLKLLTGGKHVMYLPGNNKTTESPLKNVQNELQAEQQPKLTPNRHFKNRQRHVPENMQDTTPIFPAVSHKDNNRRLEEEKPFHQRFLFNNPVRLLEKRLMSEKTVRDTDMEEAQRNNELEALKRVEEDFQRKRANEKENIRYQLRLHFGHDGEQQERYQSLPITAVLDNSIVDLNDTNNNLFCRDDPEGCVSSAPEAKIF